MPGGAGNELLLDPMPGGGGNPAGLLAKGGGARPGEGATWDDFLSSS